MTLPQLREIIAHHRAEAQRYEAAAAYADTIRDALASAACRTLAQWHQSTVTHLSELAAAFGSMFSPSSDLPSPISAAPIAALHP